MTEFVLGIWIVTAIGGSYLWSYTTGIGRPDSPARATSLPPLVLFLHPTAALTGLGVWWAYMVFGGTILPWVAFAVLVLVAVLGDVLFMRTAQSRRSEEKMVAAYAARPAGDPVDAEVLADHRHVETQIPKAAIALHGLLAAGTMVSVFLVAIGVG